jgi:hypothetical protein
MFELIINIQFSIINVQFLLAAFLLIVEYCLLNIHVAAINPATLFLFAEYMHATKS